MFWERDVLTIGSFGALCADRTISERSYFGSFASKLRGQISEHQKGSVWTVLVWDGKIMELL